VEVYHSTSEVSLNNTIITLGTFDGIHRGHQDLIDHLLAKSKALDLPALVVSFWPSPSLILADHPEDVLLLNTIREKEYLMQYFGVEHLLLLPFTKELALMNSKDFVQKILVKQLSMKHLLIGDDHRFGHDRQGDFQMLNELSSVYSFGLSQLDSIMFEGKRISSSIIRELLKSGDLNLANHFLGYPYFLIGNVIKGSQLGRTIGFPTANLACCAPNKQIPQDGVYAVEVSWNSKKYHGMLNIGTRPTVDQTKRKTFEVHIFDLDSDLYGTELKVAFYTDFGMK